MIKADGLHPRPADRRGRPIVCLAATLLPLSAQTSRLDGFAARRVICDNAHGRAPVCNPSCTSFLTGMLSPRIGVIENNVCFRHTSGNADTPALDWYRSTPATADP